MDVCILDSPMAPDVAWEVAQSTARNNAQFEAERFPTGLRRKHENSVVDQGACSGIDFER